MKSLKVDVTLRKLAIFLYPVTFHKLTYLTIIMYKYIIFYFNNVGFCIYFLYGVGHSLQGERDREKSKSLNGKSTINNCNSLEKSNDAEFAMRAPYF